MTSSFKKTYSEIKGVLKHEGLKSLISRVSVFLLNRLFVDEDYYIVTHDYSNVNKENEADYLPKTDNYCWKAISTNKEADELVVDGFNFAAYEINLRALLDKGAIAICIFVDKELGHISCVADNPRGKDAIEPLPYYVDFENGEVVVGKALTVPKFRRLHLRIYNGYVLRKFCWERGASGSRFSLRVNNFPALAIAAQPPDRLVVSKCRFIKILWFKYYKEKKMEPTPVKQIFEQIPKR